jgi:hypothetical protein
MDLFDLGRLLHSTVGTIALACFWTAALAAKGGRIHRRAGTAYLLALMGVLACSTLMVAGRAARGDPAGGIFLAFLISLVGAASWVMWFSIEYRRTPERLAGPVYRTFAAWLVLTGAALFAVGAWRREPLMMFLSLVGGGFGANMWRLARPRAGDARWWLAQHMNGAALNFIATHDSFLALGLGSVVPGIRHSVPRMLVAVGVTTAGIGLRIWLGRRHLRADRALPQPSRASGPAAAHRPTGRSLRPPGASSLEA